MMNRISKIAGFALLATGLSATAFAQTKPDHKRPTPEQRKEFLEKRLAKLSADEQRLARELFPLHDSLMRTIGDYHRKTKAGAEPRSLTSERNLIASLEAQIQRLQTENKEVWLDLLAHMPGPGGPGFEKHGMRPGRDAPPPDGRDGDGSDDLPPSSPPAH
jgi:hypothetical protein